MVNNHLHKVLVGFLVEIVNPDIIGSLAAFIGSALGPLCVMFAPTVAIERTLRKALLKQESNGDVSVAANGKR